MTDRRRKKEEKRTREDGEVDRLGLAGRSGRRNVIERADR